MAQTKSRTGKAKAKLNGKTAGKTNGVKLNGSQLNRTKLNGNEHAVQFRNRPLRSFTEEALRKYFKDLNGHQPAELYNLVLGEIELPLLQTVMDYTEGNQSVVKV